MPLRRTLLAAFPLLCLGASALAQPTSDGPPARNHHGDEPILDQGHHE